MDKTIKFEQALAELENIVGKLESGALSLDEAIKAYEKASEYAVICSERLSDAEGRIRILVEKADGFVTDAPFDTVDAGENDQA